MSDTNDEAPAPSELSAPEPEPSAPQKGKSRKKRDSSFRATIRLLRPHASPRLWSFVLVFVLASLSSLGQKAPLMLVKPLWDKVLFPEEAEKERVVEEALAAEQRLGGEGPVDQSGLFDFAWLDGKIEATQDWAEGLIFGEEVANAESASELTDETRMSALTAVCIMLLIVSCLAGVFQFLFVLLSRWLSLKLVVDLRMQIARHLMGLSMRYHSERRFGDLLSRVSNDVQVTLKVVEIFMKDLIQQPALVFASLAVAATAAPKLTLVVMAGIPLLAIPIATLGKRVRKRSRKSLKALGASVEVLTQMFRGIRTVKAFRAEERELDRYRNLNESYLSSAMKMVRAMATIQGWTIFISNAGFALVVVMVGWAAIRTDLIEKPSKMMIFLLAIAQIYTHLKRVTNGLNRIQESVGASERLLELLDERIDVSEVESAKSVTGLGDGVAFENVSFRYPQADENALTDITLELKRGETLALVGPSGSGKSTMMDLMARFIDPTAGEVLVNGERLTELKLGDWVDQYAMVGQVPFVFHDTLGNNVRYGKPNASEAEVAAATRAAHLDEFVDSLPERYETIVGDDGSRMSGGQRQRLTIARAVLKGAPLLLLDEATSALDSESEAIVQSALDQLMEDRTVVVIAHRLSTVRRADRIAVLEAGRLVEIGTHDELMKLDGTYQRLHSMQFGQAQANEGSPASA